jgi:hypothetical protein
LSQRPQPLSGKNKARVTGIQTERRRPALPLGLAFLRMKVAKQSRLLRRDCLL